MNIVKINYNDQEIEFDLSNPNIMVNATEMANACGRDLFQFTRGKDYQDFIQECLKTANLRFLGIEKEEDLITSKQRSGTWMHRVLALKFAAWLSPAFELWVYRNIEQLMFGNLRDRNKVLEESFNLRNELQELEETLKENETYLKHEELKKRLKERNKALKDMDVAYIQQNQTRLV